MIKQDNKFVVVEGTISVGKSTFLPKLKNELIKQSGEEWVHLVEDVDDPEFTKLLTKFYDEPSTENRLKFQMYITNTRYNLLNELPRDKNYLMERSLLSDLVFSQLNMLLMEAPTGEYLKYYYHIKHKLTTYPQLNACVYLSCDTRIAYDRMKARGREAEKDVKYNYLEDLDNFHKAVLPQACREYNVPLLSFNWDHFGSSQQVTEELLNLL